MPLMHTLIRINEHSSTNRQLRNEELGKLARKQRSGVCQRSRSERQCGRKREHGYFLTHHRFPPIYTTQKARKQGCLCPFLIPRREKESGKEGQSAGREFVDFVSVHFRIVKRKQRLPHAKKESGTGSHHGRGDNVSLFP